MTYQLFRVARVRPALLGLLAVTAVLYLWNLNRTGWANSFYSAAAQAGSQSWQAFFFGSSDAANSITVDKPPAALWPMALSVRIFGLNTWAILVPQALMGVAAVGVLYAAVRRHFGPAAGLLAGGVLALTPVALDMFRHNNTDALLCLLMICAVYCVLRALEDAGTKWLVLAGVCFGLGFLTKTLQAWLILPPLVLLYAVCAPATWGLRIRQLLLAGLAMIISCGWWVAIVELWPASSRPYIGGSQNNSFLELTFGYNGFGRITGNEFGSIGGGTTMLGQSGPGIGRLFATDNGTQISWLLPAAFILLGAGIWLVWQAQRTDVRRAAFLAWGGALLMTFATFSFMSGIFHQYYNIALAPYLAAIVGMGATMLWRRRGLVALPVLAGTVAVTAAWSFVLLGRAPDWLPWLRWAVLVAGLAGAIGLVAAGRLGRRAHLGAAVLALVAALAGTAGYTLKTIGAPRTGGFVVVGPASSEMRMPPISQGQPPQAPKAAPEVQAMLNENAGDYTWVAAAIGAQNSATYQLATEHPVLPIGGFNGTDPSPTLAQFQEYVAQGQIHYFIESGRVSGPAGNGAGASAEITSWIKATFTPLTVAGTVVYDLTHGHFHA